MTTHRSWSAEEKSQIVPEGMSPRANISEVYRRRGISSTAYSEGKSKALAGMKQGLKTTPGAAGTALRHENARLNKLVAEYALINDRLLETLVGHPLGKNDGGAREASLERGGDPPDHVGPHLPRGPSHPLLPAPSPPSPAPPGR